MVNELRSSDGSDETLSKAFFPDIQQWIADHPRDSQDPTIYSGAILWRLFHLVILAYQRQYPHWTYVRHEDLSREPRDGHFETCFGSTSCRSRPRPTDS